MDRYISFRAERHLHAALVAEATARGVSVSRVIRDWLTKNITRDGTPAEVRRAS